MQLASSNLLETMGKLNTLNQILKVKGKMGNLLLLLSKTGQLLYSMLWLFLI